MRFIVKSLLHINSVLAAAEDVVLLPSVSPVFEIVETVFVGIGVLTIAVAAAAGTIADAMAVLTRGVSIAFIFLFEFTLSAGCICTPSTGSDGGVDDTTPAAGRLNDACAIFVPFVEVFASSGVAIVVVAVVVVVCADVSAALSATNELGVCGTFDLLQY